MAGSACNCYGVRMNRILISSVLLMALGGTGMSACTHKVEIIPSDKPIIINLNIKIDQEIRVRLDKDIEDLLTNNPDIF